MRAPAQLLSIITAPGSRHRAVDRAPRDRAADPPSDRAQHAVADDAPPGHRPGDSADDQPGPAVRVAAIAIMIAGPAVIMVPVVPRLRGHRDACRGGQRERRGRGEFRNGSHESLSAVSLVKRASPTLVSKRKWVMTGTRCGNDGPFSITDA